MNSIERAMERFQEVNIAYKQDGAIAPSIANNKTSVVQFVPDSKPNFQLDFKSLARKGYLTPNTTHGDMAEAYRILKRPVLMNVKSNDSIQVKHSNLILITSALPGEGKTFTAFNLAMSIAFERDNTVLLVDTDLTRHSLTNLLGLNNAPGLTDV
ncbi:MAG TPA: hypothetical protein VJ508_02235, partial [Saprospiraceae bacterium]|nr:hypothetical protein [Saprospiraceae bacterium]